MADTWSDPTSAPTGYPDPTAPPSVIAVPRAEPDPVFRDDALFASASANWRAAPAPVAAPPVAGPNDSGDLALPVPPVPAPTAAALRDQAVAALKAPPAHKQPPTSRGGARSTYTAPPPQRASRRPPPARPPGSVTTSPSTWLPTSRVPANQPTPTVPWRPQPAPATWLPQTQTQTQTQTRTQAQAPAQPAGQRGGPGPVTYRASGRAPRSSRAERGGRRRSRNTGWISGAVVLAFVVLSNVAPHLGGLFHHRAPGGVDQSVNRYYTFLERGNAPQAAALICASERPSWLTSGPSSDLPLGITGHKITSTSSASGGKYTVGVDLDSAKAHSARLTVIRENGDFRVCGGTGT